ncbi:MFS transporter [Sphingomonas sp. MMS24-JH45]
MYATAPPTARYRAWVLGLLVLVYMLNFVDRQILSVLAVDLKRDLSLTDADLGFLYGTAFVLDALFGVPMGRLADSWNRVRLITIGLARWSTMTALSGLSRTGGQLAAARIGVGIGEAYRQPLRLFPAVGLFPAREARHRARDLFDRHVPRRRAVAVHRRADRDALERGLSGRRAARGWSAGRRHSWRSVCPGCCWRS